MAKVTLAFNRGGFGSRKYGKLGGRAFASAAGSGPESGLAGGGPERGHPPRIGRAIFAR